MHNISGKDSIEQVHAVYGVQAKRQSLNLTFIHFMLCPRHKEKFKPNIYALFAVSAINGKVQIEHLCTVRCVQDNRKSLNRTFIQCMLCPR